MQFQSDDYELASDIDTDLMLLDLPMSAIQENIRYQIQNPLTTQVNYIDNVADLIVQTRQVHNDDPDALNTINNFAQSFFEFIIDEIDQKFDLGITTDSFETDDFIRVGSALYQFLILRYQKNITKFIFKFILKNKKLLVETFDQQMKKKDVTTIVTKKKVKNKDDALLIANLPSVISHIINLDIDAHNFIQYVSNNELYDANIMRDLIDTGVMIGNFTQAYLNVIQVDYEGILDEIQTDVKLKLIKKL
ncbi:hypothetical protein D1872_38380 [compost metagenome]